MTPTLAIHLKFGRHLVDDPVIASAVAEIVSRPCFRVFDRLAGRVHGKLAHPSEPTVLGIARHLVNSFYDAAYLDAKEERELLAMCEIENGTRIRELMPSSIRYAVKIAMPFVADDLNEVVSAACDLAVCLQAGVGYITLEPLFSLAHQVARGDVRPRERPGVSPRRFRERQERSAYGDQLMTELCGLEWGTFLGPGHLAQIDVEAVRASGVFARVARLSPELAYLQVTEDAADDLTLAFEERLVAAREVLAPVLMPLAGVSVA